MLGWKLCCSLSTAQFLVNTMALNECSIISCKEKGMKKIKRKEGRKKTVYEN